VKPGLEGEPALSNDEALQLYHQALQMKPDRINARAFGSLMMRSMAEAQIGQQDPPTHGAGQDR